MTLKNSVCYYGLRVGCPSAKDPDCRRCAERLAHAVNQVLRQMATTGAGTSNNTSESFGDDASKRFSDLGGKAVSYSREHS